MKGERSGGRAAGRRWVGEGRVGSVDRWSDAGLLFVIFAERASKQGYTTEARGLSVEEKSVLVGYGGGSGEAGCFGGGGMAWIRGRELLPRWVVD